MEGLYQLQVRDIPRAGAVLADAFQQDPVWIKVLADWDLNRKRIFFETPVRFCLKFGEVYATSENLEGIAAWVPGDHSDMTVWRAIRSGSMLSGMKLGIRIFMNMKSIFDSMEKDRKETMKGRDYMYLIIIGVAADKQGQGFGGGLMRALIGECRRGGKTLYLETSTEQNVRMYEKLGFRQIRKITLPVIDLPQWEMILDQGGDTSAADFSQRH